MALQRVLTGLAAMTCLALTTTAMAEETRSLGPFEANHVTLQSLVAELRVTRGEDLRIELWGDAKTVKAVEVAQLGDDLTLTQPPIQVSTVVMGPGASITNEGGTVIIGGEAIEDLNTAGELAVELTLPPETSLRIADFVGDGILPDLDAPLEIVLTSGEIEAGSIGPAVFEIPGSGSIRAQAVREHLRVSIPGGGSANIDDGEVEDVEIEIAGSGDVRYLGTAERATVNIYGAGDVVLGEVGTQPDVTIAGSGTVETANW